MGVAAEAPALRIEGLSKAFGATRVLSDVSLDVREGEFLALLGPSGSGKTTLLRILAGLESADGGSVRYRGQDFLTTPARRRRVGMVFQHYALFRHMSVADNIAFGMKVKPRRERPTADAVRTRVDELLSLMQLDGLGRRFPSELSGGQRQRVALARALAIDPSMLLLDEPFGALDAEVRRDLRRWLRSVHDKTGLTTIFVTHDQEEALALADRVAILRGGKLVQAGTPAEVYGAPRDVRTYEFLGEACRVPGTVRDGVLHAEGWPPSPAGETTDGQVDICFRPDDADLEPESGDGTAVEVLAVSERGSDVRVVAHMSGRDVEFRMRDSRQWRPVRGERIRVRPRHFTLYPRVTTGTDTLDHAPLR